MPGQINRFLNFFSRSAVRVRNNLGIIAADDREGVRKTRLKTLDLYDSYVDGSQYAKLPAWDDTHDKSGEYIPVRKRQPRIVYNLAKVIQDRVASKLVGADTFPKLKVEDDPDTSEFIRVIIKQAKLRSRIIDTAKLMALSGSSFLRFYIVEGALMCETFHSNFCYPRFKANGKLLSVEIKYVYDDVNDLDENGNPKKKWYKLDLTETADILYDNPVYNAEAAPTFSPVSQAIHNLGFVQGEWFRTSIEKHSPDGASLVGEVLDFIDELNYSLSQSSQAIGYAQEPQMTIKGMDVDDIDRLIKSSTKAWNLGRDGEAKFVESNLDGVKTANEFRDKIRLGVQDVARIALLDPEKLAAHAQSGRAMEILQGPFVELINELRPLMEDSLIELVIKMAAAILIVNGQGMETEIVIPPGYAPVSMEITAHWPAIFPMTLDDLSKKAQIAIGLSGARIMSEEWATGYMAPDVGVENVEEERQKIDAQPIMSPFGPISSEGGGLAPVPGFEHVTEKGAPDA